LDPAPESLDLAAESDVEIPLLSPVTAGQPIDIPDEWATSTVPPYMVRNNS
jgi:repressor LexA